MMDAVEARLRASYPTYEWIPVTHGMSGATTYELRGRDVLYVKLGDGMLAEAQRIEWLSTVGIPGPKLCGAGDTDGVHWLVMTAVPGRPASDPWPADQRMRVIDAVVEQLLALHALPVADCPFDRTLDSLVLPAELERPRPPVEDVAVCHGDYCLPNVMIDPDTLRPTGLVDLGRLGRADRYADLALMSRSIGSETMNLQYSEAHVERFLSAYGADPTDPRLDYYRELDRLL